MQSVDLGQKRSRIGIGKNLAGVQNPFWIKHRFDSSHGSELGRAAGEVHVIFLDVTDPMFTAQGATQMNHLFKSSLIATERVWFHVVSLRSSRRMFTWRLPSPAWP